VLVVVGGAGLVGGALFAGVSLFGVLPVVSTLGSFVAKINSITPGAVGVGLGRNPSGAVPLMSEAAAPLRRDRPALAAMLVVMAGAYALRLSDVITNWPFVLVLAAAFVLASEAAKRRTRVTASRDAARPASPDDLEWVGVTVPFTAAHHARINEVLGVDELAPPMAPLPTSAGRP
jgi:branched-chain amino acid transport system permease protein